MLQADAYAGFNALFESGTIREAACWAHARRKFHDLHAARTTPLTTEALRQIAELYVIEAEMRGKPPDERRQVRQACSRPLLDDLERWLRTTLETLSRKSDTAAAILYALKLWPALLRYCDDGAIEIDNSAAERALRGVAIGRRNYLFAGADSGGERAAAVCSLIGTAKLNGVDPEAWFSEPVVSTLKQLNDSTIACLLLFDGIINANLAQPRDRRFRPKRIYFRSCRLFALPPQGPG